MLEGMPAFRPAPSLPNGSAFVRMTWGGGGVSFRTTYAYPVAGSSFAVAGDNVILDIIATDGTTVFTPQTLPVFEAWAKPLAQPTAPQPLLTPEANDLAGPATVGIFPFCRALWVYPSNQAAVITVVFNVMIGGLEERERLRAAFGSYVDPEIGRRVLAEGELLAGEEVEATVMFVDIRDFTPFAERAGQGEHHHRACLGGNVLRPLGAGVHVMEVVIGVAGTALAWLAKYYLYWWNVRRRAERIIADPDPQAPTDPTQAVCASLVVANKRRINRVSQGITLKLNGKPNGKHE